MALWANGWSLVVTKYATMFPEKAQSFGCLLIKNNIYNQVSPWYATVTGYGLMMLYLFVLAMIMLVFNCFKIKIFGMLTSASVIAFGGTFCLVKIPVMWLLPMAHTSIWLHFTDYFRKPIMPMWKSYTYFLIVILLLIIISCIAIKKTNFESLQEID